MEGKKEHDHSLEMPAKTLCTTLSNKIKNRKAKMNHKNFMCFTQSEKVLPLSLNIYVYVCIYTQRYMKEKRNLKEKQK